MLDESKLQRGELKQIAKTLMKMQDHHHDGCGISCIKHLSEYLKRGMVAEGITYIRGESDLLWSYPEIRRFIHDIIYPIGYFHEVTGVWVND